MNLRQEWMSDSDSLIQLAKNRFELQRDESLEGFDVLIDGIPKRVVIQNHTNPISKTKDDKVLHCSLSDEIHTGSIIDFDGSKWIVTNKIRENQAYKTADIIESNNTLSYYSNETQLLYEVPCIIGDRVTLGTSETKYLTTVSNEMYLTVPNTEITRQFKPNDIFNIGMHSYSISTVGDDVSANGLIIFKVVYSEVEQVVPTHNYNISILNGTNASISQGETLQLNIEVTDNGTLLSLTPIITYTSSDQTIATVDSNGLVTAIGAGGNVTITATYEGASDSIAISVVIEPQHNYTVDINTSGTLKVGQTITATALFKDNGIAISDVATSWWVLADDDVSSTNLVTLTYDGNTATIKANSTTGYVRLHVGGVNTQGSIRLQVASLW